MTTTKEEYESYCSTLGGRKKPTKEEYDEAIRQEEIERGNPAYILTDADREMFRQSVEARRRVWANLDAEEARLNRELTRDEVRRIAGVSR